MPTVQSYDTLIQACRLPRALARQLLQHASGQTREWLIGHGDELPPEPITHTFQALVRRREQGEPMAYLTGVAEFYGREFVVSPAVLIPRPETEMLAEWAIANLAANTRLLELGCGSGALCITVACERPDLQILATDIDQDALAVARKNALEHGCRAIRFVQGSWFDAVAHGQQFAAIVANPPYVAACDPHLSEDGLPCEPQHALVSGMDGLDAIRALGGDAANYLLPGGQVVLEHGYDQHEAVQEILRRGGLSRVWSAPDFAGNWRISGGTRA